MGSQPSLTFDGTFYSCFILLTYNEGWGGGLWLAEPACHREVQGLIPATSKSEPAALNKFQLLQTQEEDGGKKLLRNAAMTSFN